MSDSDVTGAELAIKTYGYIPTKSITIIFLILFSASTFLHITQSVNARMWFLIPTAGLCGALETLGWSARLWASISPENNTPFAISISCIVLAPTPFVAANFIILSRIIERLGPVYSRLKPKQYAILFCSADAFSLMIQSTGGGLAASASRRGADPALGSNITLGGIIFQTTMITIYILCGIEFFYRYFKRLPLRRVAPGSATRGIMTHDLFVLSVALSLSTVFLYTRAIYRTAELAEGFGGKLFRTEVYFNVLDGAMIVLAMYSFNFAHPGRLLRSDPGVNGTEYVAMKGRSSQKTPDSESALALA